MSVNREAPRTGRAWAVLESVPDPEIPVLSVVDLGVVESVREDGDRVDVDILPTYTGCPATEVIEADVRTALEAAGFADIRLKVCLSPPWSTDRLSEAGRRKLLDYGIAPPASKVGGKRALFANDRPRACPRCGDTATSLVSEFGSTPCKASWRCDRCLEPFEYFKCL